MLVRSPLGQAAMHIRLRRKALLLKHSCCHVSYWRMPLQTLDTILPSSALLLVLICYPLLLLFG
jgi:hypothetical protein